MADENADRKRHEAKIRERLLATVDDLLNDRISLAEAASAVSEAQAVVRKETDPSAYSALYALRRLIAGRRRSAQNKSHPGVTSPYGHVECRRTGREKR